jgi:hypothetical protein
MPLPAFIRRPWPSTLIAGALALGGAAPAAAQIQVTPPMLPYLPTVVGQQSAPQQVMVRNTTPSAVLLNGMNMWGPHPGDFQVSSSCPQTLQPGQACVAQVTFAPRQGGTRYGILLVDYQGAGSPAQVTMEGVGRAAALRFSPPSLDFGIQAVGSAPTPRAVAIYNDGPLDLHITQFALAGLHAGDFQQVSGCAQPVAPGAWCPAIVSFSPAGPGPRQASLVVTSDHDGVPGTASVLPLSGDTPRPNLTPVPGTVDFGLRDVGVPGPDVALQLQNTGGDPLVISQLSLSGSQAGEFVVPAGYSCTAAPGQSCTVLVGFVPLTAATRTAELLVTSNVPGPPRRVVLRGNGRYPAVPATLPTDDRRFLSDGSGLVPTCGTQTAPPPSLVIPVSRVVGAVPPGGGRLLAPGAAIGVGALSSTATLEIAAYNVRNGPLADPPRVILNGADVGALTGQPGAWSVTRLTVPIGTLLFPERRTAPLAPPVPAQNVVRVSVRHPGPVACTATAWARLSFGALSPVVLVHGNGSNGAFFVRQGFAGFLDASGIPNDRSINLATTTIGANAAALQRLLPPIAASFGVNSIHVVAHSKGGLDMRSWLGTFGTVNSFRVLSLTTLGTPHLGSALADAAVAVNASGIGLPGLPTASLGFLGASGPALSNLTTPFAGGFNPVVPIGADYQAIGADADRRVDGRILSSPVDEYAAARSESGTLTSLFTFSPAVADDVTTATYQFMRNTSTVRVIGILVPVPYPPFLIPLTVPLAIPRGAPVGNDLLVNLGSSLGAPAPFAPVGSFSGPGARDHASVANATMGGFVLPFLVMTDLTRGDLP